MKIKIFTYLNNINYSSEQIILFGLSNNKESLEKRYINTIDTCNKYFDYINEPQHADIFVLPYKFKSVNDAIYQELNKLSQKYNKILYCFFNDDYDGKFNITPNIKLYRTSFYKTLKSNNEYAIPAFIPDDFTGSYINPPKLSIGYCGHQMSGRKKYLDLLSNSDIATNFILRKQFRASEINFDKAYNEYLQNIQTNLFIFCYRGVGNFSYRFYETLMMGRIPILINTDCVFPFDNIIDISSIGLIIDETDLINSNKNLINEIKTYYKTNINNLLDIQHNNRKIWEDYYSCNGFITQFYKHQ
jgi:hypothetical protein